MKYGSICTGVAMLDRAVEQLWGAEPAWFAEVDKDACKVLARHYPHVPNLGDIREVDWSAVEPVDLICGGPPCQPVSQAGLRLGEKDDRFLWPDVLDIVGRLRPRWLAFENPLGFAPWLPAVARRIAELGYVGCHGVLGAADVGACHQRDRYFIVAALADAGSTGRGRDAGDAPAQEEPSGRGRAHLGDIAASLGDGLPVADADGAGREEQRRQPAHHGQPRHNADGCGAGDGAPADANSRGLGAPKPQDDARQSNIVGSGGEPPPDANGERRGAWNGWTPRPSRGGIELDSLGAEPVLARMPDGSVRDYGPALRRHAYVLGRPWPSPTIGRSLNGDFSAWMMMMPEGWLDGLSNGAKKRLAGNAVVTPQAVTALAQLRDRLLAHAEVAA